MQNGRVNEIDEMKMKSLKRVKLKNKKVIVRLDLDVPVRNNKVMDDLRLKKSLPTIDILKNAKQVIFVGHRGRPKGEDERYSLKPVAKRLGQLIKKEVSLVKDWSSKIPSKKYIMLENLRFDPGEKADDKNLAKNLSQLGDIYVNDAFAVSHRKSASINSITKYLPSYPGLSLEKEVKNIDKIIKDKKRPFILLLGGAKLDKLEMLQNLVKKADAVLIGGAMVFSFLKSNGKEIGKSKYDDESLSLARKLMKNQRNLILPTDVKLDNKKVVSVDKIPKARKGYDIGPESVRIYSQMLKEAKTIVWNGPMGYFESKEFNKATRDLAKTITSTNSVTLVGGGDTTYAVKPYLDKFTHYSPAGGAFLEMLAGKRLPGVKALER